MIVSVDGVFGNWSRWYECSVSCGGGIQWRNRSCIGPFYGGDDCSGSYKDSSTCNTHPCPSKLSYTEGENVNLKSSVFLGRQKRVYSSEKLLNLLCMLKYKLIT